MNTSAAAIKNRLLSLQNDTAQPYNFLVERFIQERALYRISQSSVAQRFMLKGGMLVTALTATFLRATRDLDLRAEIDIDPENVRNIIGNAIATVVSPDGLVFDVEEMQVEVIRKGDSYHGARCVIPVLFGTTRLSTQIDIGVGDRVFQPVIFDFPAIVDGLPIARILAYSKETIVSEKLEAIVKLADFNSRSKDFADIVALCEQFAFDAGNLWTAIDLTFSQRGTKVDGIMGALSGSDSSRESLYSGFVRRAHVVGAPPTLAECMARIERFVAGALRFRDNAQPLVWRPKEQLWEESA